MKRLAATLCLLFVLGLVACTDETKPHLPDYDPDASVLGPGSVPGSVPGGGSGGTGSADAGTDSDDASEDVSQDPDTVPDGGEQ